MPGVAGEVFYFQALDGTRLDGAVLGSGSVGVVLSNNHDQDLCQWVAGARLLAAAGFRMFLYDYRGTWLSNSAVSLGADSTRYDDDVLAAVAAIKARGASRVVLMGDGMGGLVSFAAAARVGKSLRAVVAFSPFSFYNTTDTQPSHSDPGNIDGLAAVRSLRVALMVLAMPDDKIPTLLYAAAPTSDKTYIDLPPEAFPGGGGFGLEIFNSDGSWAHSYQRTLLQFLAARA